MADVRLEHIHKRFGSNEVISDISLDIHDGEFLVLVGPSGCGKTTLLRMIAGLEDISAGNLYLNDLLANQVPPSERDIAMVFPNFALYPHMTVFDNLAFGLLGRNMSSQEIAKHVNMVAEMLELKPYLKLRPHELSGGQRQRVALGHAIAIGSHLILMDEPLLYLDAQLRTQTRIEIRKIHQRIQRTTIYVTHDQVEAMILGDRIAVMNHGIIQQIGTPQEVYDYPINQFVASFIGTPTMNFFPNAAVVCSTESVNVMVGNHKVPLPQQDNDMIRAYVNHTVTLGLRPEDLILVDNPEQAILQGTIDLIEYTDSEQLLHVEVGKSIILVRADIMLRRKVGEFIGLAIKKNKIHLFDSETAAAIR
jgi:multiple sugar transport system ATP-binding protein